MPVFSRSRRRALVGAVLLILATARPGAAQDIFGRVFESDVLGQKLRGRIVRAECPFPALGGSRNVYVYTPPGFDAATERTYPVIVLLHGTPGGSLDWFGKGDAARAVERAIEEGKFPPCLVATPDGHGPFWKGGSEWADDVGGRCRMDTAITRDLTAFLKRRFRASPNPDLWTIGGLSEGGYGAANLSVRHPDTFRNALVLSGELEVGEDWGDVQQVFGDAPEFRAANSPSVAIRRLPAAQVRRLRFYVAVGEDDDIDLQTQGVGFVSSVRTLGGGGHFVRDRGRHDWTFWKAQFAQALPMLGRWLAEPRD